MFLINFDLATNLDVEQSGAWLAPKICLGDLLALFAVVDPVCIYSNRTAMKYLRIMRFIPQFFEGFNFMHLASQIL